jgi:integrase
MSVYSVKGKGWRYDFTLMKTRYTSSWFKTKSEARRAEAKKREEVTRPAADPPQRESAPPPPPALTPAPTPTGMAFSALANEYLDHAKRKFADKTYQYKVYVYRQFLAFVGDIPVVQITIQRIEAYLRTRPTNINYNRHRKDLCALFTWAYRRRIISDNPCHFLERMPEPRFQRQIPTPEEMSKIMLAAGPDRPMLLVIYHTMARVDEVLRLRWEDVNFQERSVRLWTRKRRDGSWAWDKIPMNQVLYETLQQLWEKRIQNEWVFLNPNTGTRYRHRPKLMRTICKRAGVGHFGFHAIRHYVASYLADRQKFSITQVSRLLRHQSKATTERYLQVVDPQLREVMAALEGESHTESHIDSHTKSHIKKWPMGNQGRN